MAKRRGWARWLPWLAVLSVVASLTWVFAGDSIGSTVGSWFRHGDDRYCAAVKQHQAELSRLADAPGPGNVLKVLPIYQDLESKANDQIRPAWQLLILRIEQLQAAFRAAGVDPATYDPRTSTLSPDRKQAIQDAAAALGALDARKASGDVQQQARDVCQTSLTE